MINFTARQAALFAFAIVAAIYPVRGAEESVTSSSSTTVTPDGMSKSDVGTGVFSHLPFHLTLEVRGGYDDNVTTSNLDKQGSPFTSGNVELDYDFGDARTQLTLGVGAGVTYYFEHIQSAAGFSTQDYDINTFVRFSLTHKASERLTFSTVDYIAYLTEPDFSISQGSNYRTGNYFYTNDKQTLTYLWAPRFSTATSYTLGVLHYDDNSIGTFNNRVENTFGNEFKFLMQTETALVAEYRFELVSYEDNNNNSNNHFALAGLDHNFNPRLSASLRGGAQFREYDSGGARTSPYFEGTLNYAAGKETRFTLTTRYSIEEPDVAFNQSREVFRIGVSASHNLTEKLSASVGVYYEHSDYQSAPFAPSFTEDALDASLTLHYSITRSFSLEAGYGFTDASSDQKFREYTRNRGWGGINFAF